MPPLLLLQDIHLTFGGTPLLEGAELSVAGGERLCLVGRNGSGKSTLLKIAAGMVAFDTGTRFLQPSVTIRYLPQEPDLSVSRRPRPSWKRASGRATTRIARAICSKPSGSPAGRNPRGFPAPRAAAPPKKIHTLPAGAGLHAMPNQQCAAKASVAKHMLHLPHLKAECL